MNYITLPPGEPFTLPHVRGIFIKPDLGKHPKAFGNVMQLGTGRFRHIESIAGPGWSTRSDYYLVGIVIEDQEAHKVENTNLMVYQAERRVPRGTQAPAMQHAAGD